MADEKQDVSGTSALGEEILGDARKRADRAVRNAEREAKELLTEARQKAEAAAGEITEAARVRGERRARVELASLAVDRRRMELEAKEKVIDRIFEAAMEAAGAPERRRAAIARLGQAAAEQTSGGRLVVRVGERDAEISDEGFIAELNVRAKGGCTFTRGRSAGNVSGGVIVETADGREVFDNTFEARARRLHEAIRAELGKRLWDKKDA